MVFVLFVCLFVCLLFAFVLQLFALYIFKGNLHSWNKFLLN